ncbi:MAG: hypothetical protein AABY10_02920 [Nanoarchaeota archaeon]
MRFILEISEKERDAIRNAGKDIKKAFSKLRDSFQIKVVTNKK